MVSVEMHPRHPTGCRRFNFAVTGAKGPRGTVYSGFERTPAVCTRFRCRRHRLGSLGVWGPRAPSVGAKGPGEQLSYPKVVGTHTHLGGSCGEDYGDQRPVGPSW